MVAINEILDFYRQPSGMTDLGELDELPDGVQALAATVHGLLLHEHWAPAYGQNLSDERRSCTHTRSAGAMLEWLSTLESRPLDVRMVGTCRNFTVLMVALLQATGVPARARCGFAAYFERDKFVDHWVAEYWNDAEQRWILVDAQLDEFQQERLADPVNPLDVSPDQFLVASAAWRICWAGEADPSSFGIMDMTGLWFIGGNLFRDLAALNQVPMLPWDDWGAMPDPDQEVSPANIVLLDRIAQVTCDPDASFSELRTLYGGDGYRVPDVVFNAVRQQPEPVFS